MVLQLLNVNETYNAKNSSGSVFTASLPTDPRRPVPTPAAHANHLPADESLSNQHLASLVLDLINAYEYHQRCASIVDKVRQAGTKNCGTPTNSHYK